MKIPISNKVNSFVVLALLLIAILGCGKRSDINQSAETKPTPKKSQAKALSELRAKISSLDPNGTIVSSVREGDSDAWAVIEVTSQWHYTPKGARLELAKALQRAWASYTNRGDALIEIKDQSGNKIGGSTFTGGVYVDD